MKSGGSAVTGVAVGEAELRPNIRKTSRRSRRAEIATEGIGDQQSREFTSRVYAKLREAIMAGRFWPGQRLRIGELALTMGVSQTPVREAIMQLVREGGLEIRSSQAITVANLSLSRYKELREVRLLLEGLATEKATPLLTAAELAQLEQTHNNLVAAEASGDSEAATLANFQFHFGIYRASQTTDLITILESIWLRNGPLLKYHYPYAPPTYPGRHQHLNILDALKKRDVAAARQGVQDDMLEGGAGLVALMAKIESGEAGLVVGPHGSRSRTRRSCEPTEESEAGPNSRDVRSGKIASLADNRLTNRPRSQRAGCHCARRITKVTRIVWSCLSNACIPSWETGFR